MISLVGNMNYLGGHRQIDILEENNKGVLSINVFEEFEFNADKPTAIYRRTKVRNAKYQVTEIITLCRSKIISV